MSPPATFEFLLPGCNEATAAEILRLWQIHQALPDQVNPADRVREAIAIARVAGELVAVVTGSLTRTPRFEASFYELRIFVAPGQRAAYTGRDLFLFARARLETWDHDQPRAAGILTHYESPALRQARTEAVTPFSRSIFVGYRGENPIRINYFAHACLPQPKLPDSSGLN